MKARADASFAALVVLAGIAAGAVGVAATALGGGVAGLGALIAGWASACIFLVRETGRLPPDVLLLVILVTATLIVFAHTALRALLERRTLVRLTRSARETVLCGVPIRVVPSRRIAAFCAGVLRPRVYLTEGLVRALDVTELEVVVRHEAAHADMRAPLKSLLARVIARSFFWLPTLRDLEAVYTLTAELAADEVAVEATSQRTVVSALDRVLDSSPAVGFANVADARIERLLDPAVSPPQLVSRARLALTVVMLALVGWLAAARPHLTIAEQSHLHALAGTALVHGLVWERLVVVVLGAVGIVAWRRRAR
jgi:Zn-dependent protease with chaperone function